MTPPLFTNRSKLFVAYPWGGGGPSSLKFLTRVGLGGGVKLLIYFWEGVGSGQPGNPSGSTLDYEMARKNVLFVSPINGVPSYKYTLRDLAPC